MLIDTVFLIGNLIIVPFCLLGFVAKLSLNLTEQYNEIFTISINVQRDLGILWQRKSGPISSSILTKSLEIFVGNKCLGLTDTHK